MLDLAHVFTYHSPSPDDNNAYQSLRGMARGFAAEILNLTPPGEDQDAAIRHVREALMNANAAIALGGRTQVVVPEPEAPAPVADPAPVASA